MDARTCRVCGETKLLDELVVAKGCLAGRRPLCKVCSNRQDRERGYRTKEARFKMHLKARHNLSPIEYDEMLKEQTGVCAICGNHNHNGNQLSVDHDHLTGRTRGLLCIHCNTVLGYMNDNTNLLQKAMDYLEKYKCQN